MARKDRPEFQRKARLRLLRVLWGLLLLVVGLALLRLADPSAFRTVLLVVVAAYAVLWCLAVLVALVVGPNREPQSHSGLGGKIADWCRIVFWFSP